MKINKVDRLGVKKTKKVYYSDLKAGSVFLFNPKGELVYMTDKGHLFLDTGNYYQNGVGTREVIPVDAEINWCFKGGAE